MLRFKLLLDLFVGGDKKGFHALLLKNCLHRRLLHLLILSAHSKGFGDTAQRYLSADGARCQSFPWYVDAAAAAASALLG